VTGYQDEWKSIALKALYQHGFADHWQTDQDSLDAYLGLLRDRAIPRCIQDHHSLFHTLEEILAIKNAGNTITFPDPKWQALMRLIWSDE
jgi:hypothetical protein